MRVALGALVAASVGLGSTRARADWTDVVRPLVATELDLVGHEADRNEGENGFRVGRAHLGVRLDPARWLDAVLLTELAGESPKLLDAFVQARPRPWLELSAGLMKTPLFATAHDDFVWELPIPELALVTQAFWPRRDLGAEAHWVATERLPIDAWLRVGNGSGTEQGNDNSSFALDARLDVALGRARFGGPSSFFGARAGAGLHADDADDRRGITAQTADEFVFYRPVPVARRAAHRRSGRDRPRRAEPRRRGLGRERRTIDRAERQPERAARGAAARRVARRVRWARVDDHGPTTTARRVADQDVDRGVRRGRRRGRRARRGRRSPPAGGRRASARSRAPPTSIATTQSLRPGDQVVVLNDA